MLSCPLELGRSLMVVKFVSEELKYWALVLLDSIPKYVKLNNGRVDFHKGANVFQLADKVLFGQVSVVGYDYILVHVGINDISEWINKDWLNIYTVQDFMIMYRALHKVLRCWNRHAIIMFSSIVPWEAIFDFYFPLIRGINFALEKWCAQSAQSSGRRVFVPSHSKFRKGVGLKQCFARADGLHPNSVGTDDLQGFYQQVLTPEHVLEQVMFKRVTRLAALPY